MVEAHGGVLAAEVLKQHGVDTVFTLSGGHLFVFYDGFVQRDIRIVDVRHEQTAAFAAEGWAKVTRRPGVAALTAGPGVTNGISAMGSAWFTGSPMLVLGGRAPQGRWGAGSLQEIDHLPLVAPITKRAVTAFSGEELVKELHESLLAARTPHRAPVFLDVPLDGFGTVDVEIPPGPTPAEVAGADPDPDDVATVARLLSEAERPVLFAGADVYWGFAEGPLVELAEALSVPVFTNGMGRGTIPADHDLAFSRVRALALKEADLVVVAGTPLDFRLRFGDFGGAKVVHLVDAADQLGTHADLAASVVGNLAATLSGIAAQGSPKGHGEWVALLREAETAERAGEREALEADADPIKPSRIYGELTKRLERDAVVIGDGGDFVSYAGKYVDTYEPGCFLDPGPYGCLGMGPGYALAAKLAHPDRQVVVLYGDGAIGFALSDLDSLVRHQVPVVMIVGNNGIWGLEKHPMKAIFGYDVAADLRPGTRYDEVMTALGGHGELVTDPKEVGPAIDRAFAAGGPALVNVVTDPDDVYPRSANLA
ncbi:MAG TPA: acetolactate synthase [Acidimicrobiia bacterium]|nr:acetolactate synthase [Acidimicrobiia bacterium]